MLHFCPSRKYDHVFFSRCKYHSLPKHSIIPFLSRVGSWVDGFSKRIKTFFSNPFHTNNCEILVFAITIQPLVCLMFLRKGSITKCLKWKMFNIHVRSESQTARPSKDSTYAMFTARALLSDPTSATFTYSISPHLQLLDFIILQMRSTSLFVSILCTTICLHNFYLSIHTPLQKYYSFLWLSEWQSPKHWRHRLVKVDFLVEKTNPWFI